MKYWRADRTRLRTDVLAFARKRGRPHADRVHGTIAAQVFALFRVSVELPEIVMRTQQSPTTIRALHEEYLRPLEVALPNRRTLAITIGARANSTRESRRRGIRSDPSRPRPPSPPQSHGGARARGE